MSLVRDRTGSGLAASADQSDADMSGAEEEEVVSSPSGSTPPTTSEANKRADAKAAEWGVGKSSARSSADRSTPSDEEETEDERQTLREQEEEAEEEEDYEEDVSCRSICADTTAPDHATQPDCGTIRTVIRFRVREL